MFHEKGPSLWELAEQALSSTDKGYDLLAPKFEYTPFRTPQSILEDVLPHLGTVERGLDVCTGTGAGARMLRRACTKEVVGVDRSTGMLARARELTEADTEVDTPVKFLQLDALDMPFEEEFDVAVSFGAFGHILPHDQPAFLERIWHALKPGGRFVFVTMNPPPVWSRAYWLANGFNLAMHVRNAVIDPPFIMYYLIFLLPRATQLLWEQGFEVKVKSDVIEHDQLDFKLVIATRPVTAGSEVDGG